jgi:hypothetical protein
MPLWEFLTGFTFSLFKEDPLGCESNRLPDNLESGCPPETRVYPREKTSERLHPLFRFVS